MSAQFKVLLMNDFFGNCIGMYGNEHLRGSNRETCQNDFSTGLGALWGTWSVAAPAIHLRSLEVTPAGNDPVARPSDRRATTTELWSHMGKSPASFGYRTTFWPSICCTIFSHVRGTGASDPQERTAKCPPPFIPPPPPPPTPKTLWLWGRHGQVVIFLAFAGIIRRTHMPSL